VSSAVVEVHQCEDGAVTDLAWQPDEEDVRFYDVYGDWDPLTPAELAVLMEGFPQPWWLVGGHALEAFTGVPRFHEDIDLVMFSDALPDLRRQLGGRFHLWCNHGGTFRILDDEHPEPIDPLNQVWMRENARSPWKVDCILNPQRDGRWVSRHDDTLDAELAEVSWVADDGIRYLNPEVALLFKARQHRVKDDIDLANAWPLMDERQRTFLRDRVRRAYGDDHPWTDRLAEGG
jgi:hypothetical protein